MEDYFDNNDYDDDNNISNSSSTIIATKIISNKDNECDEYDPLDAFMSSVTEQLKKDESNIGSNKLPEIVSNMNDDEYDDYDNYMKSKDKSYNDNDNDDDKYEYDSDGNIRSGSNKKGETKSVVEPLPAIDHSIINYKPFRKNFYSVKERIESMDANDILKFRNELDISVIGNNIPDPIKTFEDAGFESFLLNNIKKLGFESPTPIQCQALPVALSGRDMIGLAKTGSGKTLAFIWPMIVHILDQPQMQVGIDGPIGIILAPTRELASQIYLEAVKFCKIFNINVCAIFGGSGKWEMTKALKESPEIVVATPGRFIDLIKAKATNLQRCTMIILDEADRMFEMGFEYQMRSIVNNIRPDRQTLLFSATMKKKVEEFARDILTNPIRVVIGTIGQSNPDIQQVVEIFQDNNQKLSWLYSHTDEFVAEGKVLVFVSSKIGTESITENLRNYFLQRQLAVGIECLHGDKDQNERSAAIKKFSKTEETAILVATDVASRGLDIKNIRTVINFEAPKNIDTYVHRIGRTGRMGLEGVIPGTAYTLLSASSDSPFAVDLVNNLTLSGLQVPADLLQLAKSDPKWSRIKHNFSNNRSSSSGGLGTGHHNQAMTSSMAADMSKKISNNTTAYGNFNKLYNTETMVDDCLTKIASNYSSQDKRSNSNITVSKQHNNSGNVLAGFVRSNQDVINSNDQQPKKKSRWSS